MTYFSKSCFSQNRLCKYRSFRNDDKKKNPHFRHVRSLPNLKPSVTNKLPSPPANLMWDTSLRPTRRTVRQSSTSPPLVRHLGFRLRVWSLVMLLNKPCLGYSKRKVILEPWGEIPSSFASKWKHRLQVSENFVASDSQVRSWLTTWPLERQRISLKNSEIFYTYSFSANLAGYVADMIRDIFAFNFSL